MSATDVATLVHLVGPDEFSSRTLAVFADTNLMLTVNGRGSCLYVHMTSAEARALAEAILANVPGEAVAR